MHGGRPTRELRLRVVGHVGCEHEDANRPAISIQLRGHIVESLGDQHFVLSVGVVCCECTERAGSLSDRWNRPLLILGNCRQQPTKKARLDEENGLDRARRRRDCFFYKYERSR